MKTILLKHGRFALVDDEDYEKLNRFKWIDEPNQNGVFYAVRSQRVGKRSIGKKNKMRMHRLIMNTPKGMQVDHINHDTLDNQKANLRNCTSAENRYNGKARRNNTTGFRGVTRKSPETARCPRERKYVEVSIRKAGKRTYLGAFILPEFAAYIYDIKAVELFGEFAALNFPALRNSYNQLIENKDRFRQMEIDIRGFCHA